MTDYEDEIIQKYNSVLYGAEVKITGRSLDGRRETITFSTPPRSEESVRVKNPPADSVRWQRKKVSPSLFLLRGITKDGTTTDTYLCRMGKPWQKIPIVFKDLNRVQYAELKRTLREWEKDNHPVQP